MAAKSAPLASESPAASLWSRFRDLAETRVRDCNAAAGEPVWLTEALAAANDARAAAETWTVRSAFWAGDSLTCCFNSATGELVCTPGSALRCGTVLFECPCGSGFVRCGDRALSLDEAVDLILDRLEWPDDAQSQGTSMIGEGE